MKQVVNLRQNYGTRTGNDMSSNESPVMLVQRKGHTMTYISTATVLRTTPLDLQGVCQSVSGMLTGVGSSDSHSQFYEREALVPALMVHAQKRSVTDVAPKEKQGEAPNDSSYQLCELQSRDETTTTPPTSAAVRFIWAPNIIENRNTLNIRTFQSRSRRLPNHFDCCTDAGRTLRFLYCLITKLLDCGIFGNRPRQCPNHLITKLSVPICRIPCCQVQNVFDHQATVDICTLWKPAV